MEVLYVWVKETKIGIILPSWSRKSNEQKEAKRQVRLEEFKESMRGIYTTSVNKSTIDEAPMAYKSR